MDFGKFAKTAYGDLIQSEVLDYDVETGTSRMRFVAPELFCSPRGVLQGGFVAAFIDDVIGLPVLVKSGATLVPITLELSISYLRPVKPGVLIGTSRIVKMGRSIAFLEAELAAENGELVAKATTTVSLQPIAGKE